jgi:hypothetical protein
MWVTRACCKHTTELFRCIHIPSDPSSEHACCPAALPRLSRCASAITGEDSALPRVKPFKYTYEKEIVMYAYFNKLDYFSTECIYAPFAARGYARCAAAAHCSVAGCLQHPLQLP